jgi:DMSO/TMAO reductase YedYZ molybdopterin-dependent catalytic subunit
MLPLASAALLIDPSWRARAIESGLALSDTASAALNAGALAPTYFDRDVTPLERYPLNSYLTHDPGIDLDEWRLRVDGLVRAPREFSLDEIRALPRVRQNTRHICIEGWDVVARRFASCCRRSSDTSRRST